MCVNEIWCSICCRYMDEGCKKCSHFDEQMHLDQEDKVDTSPEHLPVVDKEKRMTENERRIMMDLSDTILGEINRMCVTNDLSEFDTMYGYAKKNLEKLSITIYYGRFKKAGEE